MCSKWENLSVCTEDRNEICSRRHRRGSGGSESRKSSAGPWEQRRERSGRGREILWIGGGQHSWGFDRHCCWDMKTCIIREEKGREGERERREGGRRIDTWACCYKVCVYAVVDMLYQHIIPHNVLFVMYPLTILLFDFSASQLWICKQRGIFVITRSQSAHNVGHARW